VTASRCEGPRQDLRPRRRQEPPSPDRGGPGPLASARRQALSLRDPSPLVGRPLSLSHTPSIMLISVGWDPSVQPEARGPAVSRTFARTRNAPTTGEAPPVHMVWVPQGPLACRHLHGCTEQLHSTMLARSLVGGEIQVSFIPFFGLCRSRSSRAPFVLEPAADQAMKRKK